LNPDFAWIPKKKPGELDDVTGAWASTYSEAVYNADALGAIALGLCPPPDGKTAADLCDPPPGLTVAAKIAWLLANCEGVTQRIRIGAR
jgi:hypothetical protein